MNERARPYFHRGYGIDFRIGLGIHWGSVVAGQIGHHASRRLTLIGEAVNFASRIESATKQVGVPLLVSPAARTRAEADFAWTEFAGLDLPGIEGPQHLHAPQSR